MTLLHSDFNATLVAARFDDLGDNGYFDNPVVVVVGRVFDDRDGRFEDGELIHTSRIIEQHWVSDGEWVVRTKHSLYHVFETGYKGLEGMPPNA